MDTRRVLLALAVVIAVIAIPLASMAESPDEAVYLSLGTSLSAGSMADPFGNTAELSDQSFTDQLYQRIKGRIAIELTHVKLGCPGETTDRFMGVESSVCALDYATGSQLGDALQTLAGGNVELITIEIGANDITRAIGICGFDLTCLTTAIQTIAGKVAQIVATLRVAGSYSGPIIGMTYYNPFVAAAIGFFDGVPGQHTPNPVLAAQSDLLAQGFNGALAQAYAATGAQVADVYAAFSAGDFTDKSPMNDIADNVDVLCKLSYMCPDESTAKPNRHLNAMGYKVAAKAFLDVVAGIDFDK